MATFLERRVNRHPIDRAPVRVQFWYKQRFLGSAPVRIIDGKPDDIKWRPKEHVKIDRLVFLHAGNLWIQKCDLEAWSGELIQINLYHLKLYDKFGINVVVIHLKDFISIRSITNS